MTMRGKRTPRLPVPYAVALGVAVLAIAVPLVARGMGVGVTPRPTTPATPRDTAAEATAPAVVSAVTTAPAATAATPAPAAARPVAPVAKPVAPVAKPKPQAKAVPVKASADVYKGLGSWVDIYDDRAWNDPSAAVRDMARHGVKTLYLETGNSKAAFAVKSPSAVATFIRTAHANKMRVVAWYLPDLTNVQRDYDRVASAIGFRTSDGQKFDSFALDIESDAVKSVSDRNARLETLSRKIRALGGKTYPLGAIIPSPVGIAKNGSWAPFPYTMLAGQYDAFVPMSYYTWHGKGNQAAYADTAANMRILHSQKGCANTPVHLIGGLAEESTPSEVRAFVQAGRASGAVGASLYTWTGTTDDHWKQLSAVK